MSNNLERTLPSSTSSQKTVLLNESDSVIEGAATSFLTKALDGDGSTSMTSGAAKRQALENALFDFTGALTGDENVIVPNNTKFYECRDSTTGGHDVTVKTNAGTGVVLDLGNWVRLYCDGTNVIQIFP